jgi:hypothetical protein
MRTSWTYKNISAVSNGNGYTLSSNRDHINRRTFIAAGELSRGIRAQVSRLGCVYGC